MEVQQAEGGWHWQTRLETGFCPHHPSLAWLAPSMWFGIVWKQARFLAHISFWGWKEMRHLCGIFWLGDVGKQEGLAPSMSAFPAWFWRMSGTCAIYVPQRQLDVEEKLWVQTSAEDCKKLGHFWTYMARTTCLKMELRHLSPVFCLWQRWRNSIFRAMYFQSGVGDKQSFFRLLVSAFMLSFSCFFLCVMLWMKECCCYCYCL